ncbi:MAG: acyltransferase [Prevotella sp.]|nr:acyltransferase [Prevotella sp.]
MNIKSLVRPFYYALRHSQYRPCPFFRFIWLNFFSKHVKTDWKNNGFIYPTPYSLIELRKGSVIEMHGPVIIGRKKLRRSHVETRLLLENNARLVVHKYFGLGYGSDVEVFKNALLDIVFCNTNFKCTIICGKKIEVRGHLYVGREVSIRDTNAHWMDIDGYKMMRSVIIEDHVWLCSGVTVSPGVKIRGGVVVGACSYVIQNVPAHTLVSGHPAKVAMTDVKWKM